MMMKLPPLLLLLLMLWLLLMMAKQELEEGDVMKKTKNLKKRKNELKVKELPSQTSVDD